MASKTTNYNLDMPGYNEIADIDVINGNMDKIDVQMKKNADSAQQSKDIVSDEYSATNTYAVGDYCIHENALYKCKTAITTGEAFDSSKWVQTTCGTEFGELNSNLDDLSYGDTNGGKNILNIQNPVTVTSAWFKSFFFKCKKNTTYTVSFNVKSYTVAFNAVIYTKTERLSEYSANNKITFNSGNNDELYLYLYSGNGSVGTTVYSNVQIEKGSKVTEYEPYIPSVKILADEVSTQNESLEDYGLNNVFDDEYKEGFYESDGSYYSNPQWKTTKNSLIVSSGNLLSVNLDSIPTYARIVYFNDNNTFVSYEDFNSVKNAKLTVPSGATKYYISMFPNTCNIESIYINNSIDEIKNDLVNIDIVANSNLNADTWAADFFGLPNPSQRTIYNVYNHTTGKFSHLCKRKDGAILSDLEITNGVKYHISGFNS